MTLIEQLAAMIAPIPGATVQRNAKEMLVTLNVGDHRRQAVRVATQFGANGQPFVRMQSRARAVQEHKLVRAAIGQNAKNTATALALDASINPPMLDVVFGMPAVNLYPGEFIDALFRVANHADAIEQSAGGSDSF